MVLSLLVSLVAAEPGQRARKTWLLVPCRSSRKPITKKLHASIDLIGRQIEPAWSDSPRRQQDFSVAANGLTMGRKADELPASV